MTKDEKNIRSLENINTRDTRLDTGWAWVVLLASFMTFVVIGGSMYSVGLIHAALIERYRQDIAKTAWAAGLNSALVSGAGPLSSFLVDRFSCRVAIMTSGILFTVGYLTTAFSSNLELCIFTCGLVAGLGGAAGYTAAMVVIGFNFKKRRNIAMGIAVSGVGAGLFTLAPLIQFAKEHYGTVGFFIALAGISFHLLIFGALCRPSSLEQETQRMRKREVQLQEKMNKQNRCLSVKSYIQVLTNRAVICLCISMFTYCLGTHLLFLHLPSYSVSKGFSQMQSSFFLSVLGAMSIVGRILSGFASKKVDDLLLYSGTMGILTLGTFLFPIYSSSFPGQIIYFVIFGLFFGSCYVVLGSINITFVGVQYMSSGIGLEFMFGGIGAVIGPVVAGFILDSGGTYQSTLFVAATFTLIGSLSGLVTKMLGKPVNNKDKSITIPVNEENHTENSQTIQLQLLNTDITIQTDPGRRKKRQISTEDHHESSAADQDFPQENLLSSPNT